MKDFSNASFPPDTIQVMTVAMKNALSTLPHPVSSTHVQSVAETILRTAKDGERDPKSEWHFWNFEFRPDPSLLLDRALGRLTIKLTLPEQFLTFHLGGVQRMFNSFMLLAAEATGVVALRMMKLMRGGRSARREANLMISEKISAAFEATASLVAGASGDDTDST